MLTIRHLLAATALGLAASVAPAEPAIAVVELFTSEGCSSCPPAEELAARVNADAARAADTIVVAWHVDYWDYLGWKDRLASPENTHRQRVVCRELGSDRIYTPQSVVNGRTHFVGSDATRTRTAIDAVHAQPAALRIQATAAPAADDPRAFDVAWTATADGGAALPEGARVEMIVVEDGLVSNVTGGENAGRTLHHDGVARATATQALGTDGVGRAQVRLPDDAVVERSRVVVIARAANSMAVIGAAKAKGVGEQAAPTPATTPDG